MSSDSQSVIVRALVRQLWPGGATADHALAAGIQDSLRAVFGVTVPDQVVRSGAEACADHVCARIEERNRAGETHGDSAALLTTGQEQLWFLDQLAPQTATYNIALACDLEGDLAVDRLVAAVKAVIRRHDVLRLRVDDSEGSPVGVILPPEAIPVVVDDMSAGSREVEDLVSEFARRPFDLATGPLVRVRIWRVAPDRHVFCWVMHHMVGDGSSNAVLCEDIAAAYRGEIEGRQDTLPPLANQFADFAAAEAYEFAGPEFKEKEAHWRRVLQGVNPVLDVAPGSRARSSQRGADLEIPIDQELLEGLRRVAQGQRASLFMVVFSAFSALLSRYSSARDFLVGVPISRRSDIKWEGLAGLFLNVVPLRVQVEPEFTFRELVGKVRETALAAFDNQQVPFERIVKLVTLKREPDRNPLVQVLFQQRRAPMDALELPGVACRARKVAIGSSQVDLELDVQESKDGGAVGWLVYDRDRIERSWAERFAEHLVAALRRVVLDPDAPLSSVWSLPAALRDQVVIDFNRTDIAIPSTPCFPDLFEAQVAATPDAVAARCRGETITYGSLDARAGILAGHLVDSGVGPDAVVVLLAERGIPLLTAIVGVLKAGGAYLALDPRYPVERHREMIDSSRAVAILAEGRFMADAADAIATALPARRPTLLQLDGLVAPANGERAPRRVDSQNLAYVIYTSGSTGRPKGAMLDNRGLLNHLYAMVRDLPMSAGDALAQNASQCFDVSVWQFLAPLIVGGRVEIYPDEVASDGLRLLEEVDRDGVTILEIVPSQMAALLEELAARPNAGLALRRLRWLIPTGEVLSPELCRAWFERFPHVPLLNAYGPAECSDDVTYFALYHPPAGTNVSIGGPIGNMRMYVLDEAFEPVPIGVPGELFVGGIGVGRGYLNDPWRTAERYLPEPLSGEVGSRMYRSGDLVRWLPNGTLEFVSRVDHQVKVRGYRIELGEIESVLGQHPRVGETVVMAREDVQGDRRLVAYVTCPVGPPPLPAELREHLRKKLPEYMVPAAYVFLGELPHLVSGKVDRRSLPAPDPSLLEGSEYVAPRTPREETLAAAFGEVLGRERVGIHDNFFELGGDSILTIRVVARAVRAGLAITPRHLFERPTVAELATLESLEQGGEVAERSAPGLIPLTPVQRWFFGQDLASAQRAVGSISLSATGVRPSLLRRAAAALLDHHDALRTRFVRSASGAWQAEDAGKLDPPFVHVDLSMLSADETPAALESALGEIERAIDLAGGPLIQVSLVDLEDGGQRVVVVAHDLVVDAASWRILTADLELAYQQLERGEPVSLPAGASSFAEWARRHERRARGLATSAAPDARGERAGDLSLRPDRGADGDREATETIIDTLDEVETEAILRELSATYRAEVEELLLAAWARSLSTWSGASRLHIDLWSSGREPVVGSPDLSRTVGALARIAPLVLDLDDLAPASVLKTVKEGVRALPGRDLDGIAPDGAASASGRRAPVRFSYVGATDQRRATSSASRWVEVDQRPARGRRQPQYELDVEAFVRAGRLHLVTTGGDDVSGRGPLGLLAQEFGAAVRALAARRPEPVAYIPSDFPDADLSEAELRDLVGED